MVERLDVFFFAAFFRVAFFGAVFLRADFFVAFFLTAAFRVDFLAAIERSFGRAHPVDESKANRVPFSTRFFSVLREIRESKAAFRPRSEAQNRK
jgi:hypothetical protein